MVSLPPANLMWCCDPAVNGWRRANGKIFTEVGAHGALLGLIVALLVYWAAMRVRVRPT